MEADILAYLGQKEFPTRPYSPSSTGRPLPLSLSPAARAGQAN